MNIVKILLQFLATGIEIMLVFGILPSMAHAWKIFPESILYWALFTPAIFMFINWLFLMACDKIIRRYFLIIEDEKVYVEKVNEMVVCIYKLQVVAVVVYVAHRVLSHYNW